MFTFNHHTNNIILKLANESNVKLQQKRGLYHLDLFDAIKRSVYIKWSVFVEALEEEHKPIWKDMEYADLKPLSFMYFCKDELLTDLLKSISETNGINTDIENPSLNSCHFTRDISRQTLYEKLDIVCEGSIFLPIKRSFFLCKRLR